MVFNLKTYIMENENVRIATPEEAKENKRKQRIMLISSYCFYFLNINRFDIRVMEDLGATSIYITFL